MKRQECFRKSIVRLGWTKNLPSTNSNSNSSHHAHDHHPTNHPNTSTSGFALNRAISRYQALVFLSTSVMNLFLWLMDVFLLPPPFFFRRIELLITVLYI